jgi:hypothetical protein
MCQLAKNKGSQSMNQTGRETEYYLVDTTSASATTQNNSFLSKDRGSCAGGLETTPLTF